MPFLVFCRIASKFWCAARCDLDIGRWRPARESAERIRHACFGLCAASFLVLVAACETAAVRPDTGPGPLRDILLKSATSSFAAHEYSSAVAAYQTLYARDPTDVEVIVGLVRNLRYAGSVDNAIAIAESAMARPIKDPRLLAERGKLELARGRPEGAIYYFRDLIGQGIADWQIHSAFGIACDLLGWFEEAREAYHAALAASPGNASVLNNLALSYALQGDVDRAITILTRVAESPAAAIQIRQNLGLLYAFKGETSRAGDIARRDLPPREAASNLDYYRAIRNSLRTHVD